MFNMISTCIYHAIYDYAYTIVYEYYFVSFRQTLASSLIFCLSNLQRSDMILTTLKHFFNIFRLFEPWSRILTFLYSLDHLRKNTDKISYQTNLIFVHFCMLNLSDLMLITLFAFGNERDAPVFASQYDVIPSGKKMMKIGSFCLKAKSGKLIF